MNALLVILTCDVGYCMLSIIKLIKCHLFGGLKSCLLMETFSAKTVMCYRALLNVLEFFSSSEISNICSYYLIL